MKYKVRDFGRADLENLLDLIARNSPNGRKDSNRFLKMWEWKYIKNPSARAQNSYMWVIEVEDKIVGFLGGCPSIIKINGRILPSAWAANFLIDESYRFLGIILADHFLRKIEFALNSGMTEVAAAIMKRYGMKNVKLNKTFVKYLKVNYFFELYATHKNWLRRLFKIYKFIILLSFILNTFLKSYLLLKTQGEPPRNLKVKQVEYFDECFDTFLKDITRKYQVALLKNAQYLNWRYISFPGGRYYIYAVFENEKALKGYIIFGILRDFRGLLYARIMDFLVHPYNERVGEILIKKMTKFLLKSEVNYIVGRRILFELQPLLLQNGFIRAKHWEGEFLVKDKSGAANDIIFDEKNWLLAEGDGEDSFSFYPLVNL